MDLDGLRRSAPPGRPGAPRLGADAVAIVRFSSPLRAVITLIAGRFGVGRLPVLVANCGLAAVWGFGLQAPDAGLVAWFKS